MRLLQMGNTIPAAVFFRAGTGWFHDRNIDFCKDFFII